MKLVYVAEEDRVDGENYLTKMKHGIISGRWNAKEEVCVGYYWQNLEWFPYTTYLVEED